MMHGCKQTLFALSESNLIYSLQNETKKYKDILNQNNLIL